MTTLAHIGPVQVTMLGNVKLSHAANQDRNLRTFPLSGLMPVREAESLAELAINTHRQVSFRRHTGVLEYVRVGEHVPAGMYIIERFDVDREHIDLLNDWAPFRMDAVAVADRELILVRSARDKGDDFGLTPRTLVAYPYAGDDGRADDFTLRLPGTRFTRDGESGALTLIERAFVGTDDPFPPEAMISQAGQTSAPEWVTDRTFDVRLYDRREEREVYGPHTFAEPADIEMRNGLMRVQVGPRGVAPYLWARAWRAGAWRDVGCIGLERFVYDRLYSARLLHVNPERATVAVTADGIGDAHITLVRGWRGVIVSSPHLEPARSAGRYGRCRAVPTPLHVVPQPDGGS